MYDDNLIIEKKKKHRTELRHYKKRIIKILSKPIGFFLLFINLNLSNIRDG